MRPRGEIREVLARGLAVGVGNTRDLALRTGVGITAARQTLDNMCRSGEVRVVREDRIPGVKRPVPVYGPARTVSGFDWSLVTSWALWPTDSQGAHG